MKVIDRVVTFSNGKKNVADGQDLKAYENVDKVFDGLVEQGYISGYMIVYHIEEGSK